MQKPHLKTGDFVTVSDTDNPNEKIFWSAIIKSRSENYAIVKSLEAKKLPFSGSLFVRRISELSKN
jgi:hypothetical protein